MYPPHTYVHLRSISHLAAPAAQLAPLAPVVHVDGVVVVGGDRHQARARGAEGQRAEAARLLVELDASELRNGCGAVGLGAGAGVPDADVGAFIC